MRRKTGKQSDQCKNNTGNIDNYIKRRRTARGHIHQSAAKVINAALSNLPPSTANSSCWSSASKVPMNQDNVISCTFSSSDKDS